MGSEMCIRDRDRTAYDSGILKIISDTSKFKVLAEDMTLLREGQLQRFLRNKSSLKSRKELNCPGFDCLPFLRILVNRGMANK